MKHLVVTVIIFALLLLSPVASRAQSVGAIEGFGGMSLTAGPTVPNLGGTVTVSLLPGFQIVGDAGRTGNVLPPLAGAVFSAARTGIRASAWYVDGGVRVLAAPGARVSPYAEATAGIARLDISTTRFGATGNAIASAAFSLIGRNAPMAGVGAGVLVSGGPIVFDAGYRYQQIFPSNLLQGALGLGQRLGSNQLRVGIGVRF